MIYIKETFPDDQTVDVEVDGILDIESIAILKEICERHLRDKRKIVLRLEKLFKITREGRNFLKEIQKLIIIQGYPQFMKVNEAGKWGMNGRREK